MKFLQRWYVYLVRGTLAIVLGILLLTERAQWNAVQFMGLFWLSIGLTSIAWARSKGKRIRWARWSLAAGILGVLAGLIALARPVVVHYFATWIFVSLVGVVSIITGLLHIFGGFRSGPEYGPHWSWGSYLMGSVQLILGTVALISPWEPTRVAWWAAGGWCLIAGILLLLDAWRMWVLKSSEATDDQA